MLSSAQVLRELQKHFNPSELFAPWISVEKSNRAREHHNQRQKRRNRTIEVKIGHGGTLDPLATGVLITGVGTGTKALQRFLLCTKTYEAVVLFGTSTDSYDRVGKVIKNAPYEHVTKEAVERALQRFRGKFMQLPPLFSALKMNGKPLYEYAREGKEIPRQIERREVEVLNLELVEWMEGGTHPHKAPHEHAGRAEINVAQTLWKQEGSLPAGKSADEETNKGATDKKRKSSYGEDDLVKDLPDQKHRKLTSAEEPIMSGGLDGESSASASTSRETVTGDVKSVAKGPPAVKLRMTVTSGFYVRSLCHDLGAELGSAALMAELQRTQQGQFELGKNVLEYSDLEKGEAVWGPQVEEMLDDWYEKEEKPHLSWTKRRASSTAEEAQKVAASDESKPTEESSKSDSAVKDAVEGKE